MSSYGDIPSGGLGALGDEIVNLKESQSPSEMAETGPCWLRERLCG